MKTELTFEDSDTKKLLTKLDFEYFLRQNFRAESYQQTAIDKLYEAFKDKSEDLRKRAGENRRQLHLYAEGQVRKMFTGGLLPTLFHLNDLRGLTITDFAGVGGNWAYFDHWQRYHKRTLRREKAWTIIVRTGSILAFVLSFLKLLEYGGIAPNLN